MALIKCPECGKEISDSVNKCPHCGYQMKKRKKSIGIIIAILIIALIGGAVAYLCVIKPNSVMNQAANLISRGKFSDADLLLASIPNNSRKAELMEEINLGEAREALENGNYELAEKKISVISEGKVPEDLKYAIIEQKASELIYEGKYDEADDLYSNLPQSEEITQKRNEINNTAANVLLANGQYVDADMRLARIEQTEEIVDLRKKLFYESRVLQCALMVKDTLLFPESIKITEAVVFEGGKTKNENESTEETEVYYFDQPWILLHYQAKTRGGSISDGFVRFTWDNDKYNMHISVDSLKTDSDSERESKLKYMDTDEIEEYREEQLEISMIGLLLVVSSPETSLEDEQLERVNNALQATKSKTVDFIPNNEIVPLPTPKRVTVTPEPTQEPETIMPQSKQEPVESNTTENYYSDTPVGYEVGQQLADFTTPLIGEGEFHLADTRGKIVFINLWGMHSKTSVDEIPFFEELKKRHPDIEVLAIHLGLFNTEQQVSDFLVDKGWNQLKYAIDGKEQPLFKIVNGSTKLPQTIILNKKGEVVFNACGSVTYETLEQLLHHAESSNDDEKPASGSQEDDKTRDTKSSIE